MSSYVWYKIQHCDTYRQAQPWIDSLLDGKPTHFEGAIEGWNAAKEYLAVLKASPSAFAFRMVRVTEEVVG